MSALRPGDRIADRYVVDTVIARGGMGAVYRATDERLGRAVAVKVLLPELGEDQTSLARFEREARATARLSHPSIVSVFDFGTMPGGLAYLVMEHVVGTTFAQALEGGRLAPARAADLVEQSLGALGVAHAAGIVHRDLKPGNLMIVPVGAGGRELVKVLDFGIAQLKAGTAYTRLTRTGMIVGTPTFMSPEQARAEPCDGRADVYAMGMVLWCCLTGVRPFRTRDVAALVEAVQAEVPPRADQLVPQVPSAFATIASKAIEKRAENRFANVGEFAAALVEARSAAQAAPVMAIATQQPSSSVTRPITQPFAPPSIASVPATQPAAMHAPPSVVLPPTAAGMVPMTAPSAPIAAAAASRPSMMPRIVGCVGALLVGSLLGVLGVGLLVRAYLDPLTETSSYGGPPPSEPSGSSAPTLGGLPLPLPSPGVPGLSEAAYGEPVCQHAIDCCHSYVDHGGVLMPTCEQVVGFSHGELQSCTRQLDMWRNLARDNHMTLAECE